MIKKRIESARKSIGHKSQSQNRPVIRGETTGIIYIMLKYLKNIARIAYKILISNNKFVLIKMNKIKPQHLRISDKNNTKNK